MVKNTKTEAAFVRPKFIDKPVTDRPQLPDTIAVVYVIATALILTYSSLLFGIVPILIFYAIWLRYYAYKGKNILKITPDVYLLVALAAIVVLSTAWSDERAITAKGSLEYASMIVVTVIVARIVSMRAFVRGLVIGIFLVLLVTFKSGTYSIEGLFGSKNVVGGYAELGIFFTLLYWYGERKNILNILFAAGMGAFFTGCLYLSQSATSVASLVGAIWICTVGFLIGKLPKNIRGPVFIFAIIVMLIAIGVGYYEGLQNVGLDALGKDSSLTGRTYIWEQGIKFGLERLWTGCGYGAFWVIGRPEAEALWFKFGIYERSGFHFHNLYVNTFVELGIFGVLTVAAIYAVTCLKSFQYLTKHGASQEALFYIGFACMFLMRSMAEIDTAGPFGISPMIFYAIIPRIAAATNENKEPYKNFPKLSAR